MSNTPFNPLGGGLVTLLLGLGLIAPASVDAADWPKPPRQTEAWSVATEAIPPQFISATEALFAAGMADPRGGEYRNVVLQVGSLSSGDGGKVQTRAWVLPGEGTPRFAVAWNGLVYPLLSVGGPADLAKDVEAARSGRYEERGWIPRESEAVSATVPSPLKGCLLLRAGETGLAHDFWLSLQVRHEATKPKPRQAPVRSFSDTPAPKTNAEPAQLDSAAPDPFLNWATVWLGGAVDRALTAHIRGDDEVALLLTRELTEVGSRLNELARTRKTASTNMSFPALDVLPALLRDQERRAAGRPNRPAVAEVAKLENVDQRVQGALALFDEIVVRPRNGGLNFWSDSPQFSVVLDAGQAAVEPLLTLLESAEATHLTRCVSYERDYLPRRILYPVSEPVLAALKTLLRLDSFDAVLPPVKVAQAGTNAHRAMASALRDYIKKADLKTEQETWYSILQNDAAPAAWPKAMRDIVAPSRSRGSRSASGTVPMAGEILRAKTAPSVSELMVRRIGRWKPLLSDSDFGLVEFRDALKVLGRWDEAAALALAEQTLADCQAVWAEESAKPDRNSGLSKVAARGFSTLVVELAQAGRTNVLETYAQWIGQVGEGDYGTWISDYADQPNPFQPLWLYPEHPGIADVLTRLFDPAQSKLGLWLRPESGLKALAVVEAGTPLGGLPAFQPLLLAALADKSVVGTVYRPGGGRYEVNDNTGQRYTRRLIADRSLDEKQPAMTLRVADAVAKKLDSWPNCPRFEVFWNEPERDARIAEYVALIQTEGARFGRRAVKEAR